MKYNPCEEFSYQEDYILDDTSHHLYFFIQKDLVSLFHLVIFETKKYINTDIMYQHIRIYY